MVDSQPWEGISAEVKERADIVQIIGECVDLKRSGVRYLGLCPFHGEKTPSFSVHSGQQFFYCFGCGESGDVFTFMMKYYNLDFSGALKELARRYQIQLPERPVSAEEQRRKELRRHIYRVNERAASIFRRYLQEAHEAASAREYLQQRGISPDTQEKFMIGYAPSVEIAGWDFLARQLRDGERGAAEAAGLVVKKERGGVYDRFRDRILFPIYETDGKVAGFGGRIIGEGQPKYMNSPESPVFDKSRLLLGLFQQKEAIRKQRRVILVEGNFDMISMVAGGCENVVAPLGTALTGKQIRILKNIADTATLLFDGDAAGLKAAVRAVPLFLSERMEGTVALLPPGHDPDTFIRQMGLQELDKLLERAEPLAEFILAHFIKEHGLTLSGKSRIVEELLPIIRGAGSSLQRSIMISHFGEKLGISADEIASALSGEKEKVRPTAPVIQSKAHSMLTAVQKRLTGFMVMHPSELAKLEAAGIREFLAGGIGEILFLQLKVLLQKQNDVQPEELLTELPKGPEHDFVMEILLSASSFVSDGQDGADLEEELVEVIEWLRIEKLKRQSEEILKKIGDIQGDYAQEELALLLERKQKVDRELRGIGG